MKLPLKNTSYARLLCTNTLHIWGCLQKIFLAIPWQGSIGKNLVEREKGIDCVQGDFFSMMLKRWKELEREERELLSFYVKV